MEENIEKIKSDLFALEPNVFFNRYYLNDDYWYFRQVLKYTDETMALQIKSFKDIISQHNKYNANPEFISLQNDEY